MRTELIEATINVCIDEEEYDLFEFLFEADYEIDGEDVRPSYYDPGDRASWVLLDLRIASQEMVVAYNEEAEEWGGKLPWNEGDSVFEFLSPRDIGSIERTLEEMDRYGEVDV